MAENYYIFRLDDPAKPGFCSFDKMYVGTKTTLNIVTNNLEKEQDYPETVEVLRSYFNGNYKATNNIAYSEMKILTPIKIVSEHETVFGKKCWTHINIWGFPYEMKCDSGLIHQIIFKHDKKYYRCIRAWLKNLCYESVSGDWHRLTDGFWGNAAVLDVTFTPDSTDFTFNNLLYVVEEIYDDLLAASDDITNIDKITMKGICEEIFADG